MQYAHVATLPCVLGHSGAGSQASRHNLRRDVAAADLAQQMLHNEQMAQNVLFLQGRQAIEPCNAWFHVLSIFGLNLVLVCEFEGCDSKFHSLNMVQGLQRLLRQRSS